MIYRMSRDVGTALQARGYPITVTYGPEPVDGTGVSPRSHSLEFSRDTAAGDAVRAPQGGRHVNQALVAVRDIGVRVILRVRSSLSGARLSEHENECDKLVDALISALIEWCKEAKTGADPAWRESRYLSPEELGGAEQTAGTAYMLRFTIPRGVTVRRYDGVQPDTGSPTGTESTVRVVKPGTPPYEQVLPPPGD